MAAGPTMHQWSPYVMNSGTVMAICGKDFAVIAGDTRMSVGYQIQSRNVGKLLKVTDKAVLGTGGHCQADTLNLQKLLRARMVQYEHQNGKTAKTSAIAQLVSQMLYGRRFFPMLTKNIVAGLDEDGARRCAAALARALAHYGPSARSAARVLAAVLSALPVRRGCGCFQPTQPNLTLRSAAPLLGARRCGLHLHLRRRRLPRARPRRVRRLRGGADPASARQHSRAAAPAGQAKAAAAARRPLARRGAAPRSAACVLVPRARRVRLPWPDCAALRPP